MNCWGYFRLGLLVTALAVGARAASPLVVYVSPDGDDANSGVEPSQAWRSLARAQSAVTGGLFASGGEIRLARGATFVGSLVIRDLTLTAPAVLRIGAYGEGPAPVISGTIPVTGWVDLGSGLWRAKCAECATLPALLTHDGATQPLARWPNGDAPGRGYLYYEASAGRTSITDDDLPAGVDWTGAEVVLRSAAWILDRLPVASQKDKTLTFSTPATYEIPKGYGYFLQNHLAALDRDGEWIFDAATRQITVMLAPDSPPADHEFRVSVTDALISISRSQGIEIADVVLAGAQRANLDIQRSTAVVVRGVESRQSGDVGARCIDCNGFVLEDSVIDGALNHGLDVYNCGACRVSRNRIVNTATVAGMGRSGNGQYNGVRFGGAGSLFEQNEVRRTGYLGVDIRGPARIRRNSFSEFNLVKTDGAGIYTWTNKDVEIVENLVFDGVGSTEAVPWNSPATNGIYIDDQSEQVVVRGNTVVNVASDGIFLHNTRDVQVEGNTIVSSGGAQIAYGDDNLGSYTVTGTAVKGNLFVNTRPGALLARATTTGPPSFFSAIGSMSGNRYCSPFEEPLFGTSLASQRRLLFDQWPAFIGTDVDASLCPQRFAPVQVKAELGADRVQNGRFDSGISPWFGWPSDSLQASWDAGRLRLRHVADAPIIHYDAPVGLIEAGKSYRLRFRAQSDAPNRWLRVYLRKWDPDYRYLAEVVDLPLTDQVQARELVFTATQTEPRSLLIFELPNASRVVWLDDVELIPVEAEAVSRSSLIRVETNPSADPREVVLDEECSGPDGRVWPAGSVVTIAPFGSQVLFRTGR